MNKVKEDLQSSAVRPDLLSKVSKGQQKKQQLKALVKTVISQTSKKMRSEMIGELNPKELDNILSKHSKDSQLTEDKSQSKRNSGSTDIPIQTNNQLISMSVTSAQSTNQTQKSKSPRSMTKEPHTSSIGDLRKSSIDRKSSGSVNSNSSARHSNINLSASSTPVKQLESVNATARRTSILENICQMNAITNIPEMQAFDGKFYTVYPVSNNIKNCRKYSSNKGERHFELGSLLPVKKLNDLENIKNEFNLTKREGRNNLLSTERIPKQETPRNAQQGLNAEDLNDFLQDYLITPREQSTNKYREVLLNEAEYEDNRGRSINTLNGEKGEALEDRFGSMVSIEENLNEERQSKKVLSIIFSTGKSMETSRDSRNTINGGENNYQEVTILITEEDATSRNNKYQSFRERYMITDERSELAAKSQNKHSDNKREQDVGNILGKSSSNLNSDIYLTQSFGEVIEQIQTQNRGNLDLFDGLSRLMVLHNKSLENFEEKMELIVERCKTYKEANDCLAQVVKNWETQMDQLGTANKSLHEFVRSLENDLHAKNKNEISLTQLLREQEAEMAEIHNHYKAELGELEILRDRIKRRDNKVSSLSYQVKNLEELTLSTSTNLKTLVKDKTMSKASTDIIYKILETSECIKAMRHTEEPKSVGVIKGGDIPSDFSFKHRYSILQHSGSRTSNFESPTRSQIGIKGELSVGSDKEVQALKKYSMSSAVNKSAQKPQNSSNTQFRQRTPTRHNSISKGLDASGNTVTSPQVESRKIAPPLSKYLNLSQEKPTTTTTSSATPSSSIKQTAQKLFLLEKKSHNLSSDTRPSNEKNKSPETEESPPILNIKKLLDKNSFDLNEKTTPIDFKKKIAS